MGAQYDTLDTTTEGTRVELEGRTCTLYPLSLTGAVIPAGYDPGPFVAAFQEEFTERLVKTGVLVRNGASDVAGDDLVVSAQLVRIEEGSRWAAVFLGFGALGALLGHLAGPAVFEVRGAVGDASRPFAQLDAVGKSSFVIPWGRNESGIKNAARLAGRSFAAKSIKTIKTS
jgi:Domain of unknown function (DUF4410)